MVGTQFLIASSSFVSHCLIRSFWASVSLSARRVYVSAHAHMQLLPVLCEQGNAEGLLTVLTQPVLPVSWHGIQSGLQMALLPPRPPSSHVPALALDFLFHLSLFPKQEMQDPKRGKEIYRHGTTSTLLRIQTKSRL